MVGILFLWRRLREINLLGSKCVRTVCERKEPTVVHIPDSEDAFTSSSLSPLTSPTSLQRFKFLANKIISSRVTTASGSEMDTVHTQLNNYIADIMEDEIKDAMKFLEQ